MARSFKAYKKQAARNVKRAVKPKKIRVKRR